MSTAVTAPLLRVTDLSVTYGVPRRGVGLGTGAALRGASLEVYPGEIVGIIGETGSGKTTLARATVGLTAPAGGTIEFDGRDLTSLRGRELRKFRRQGRIQLVFQDPLRSLDPDLTVARLVGEPLEVAGGRDATRGERIDRALREVGLDPDVVRDRRPRDLSGGQRQRVSLARAIVTEPQLLICDEPVSALDVSNRNLVLNLLDRLRRDLGLAVVIIAHDLSSLAGIGDRVAVFYRSRLVEQGNLHEVLTRPAHPYTALLVASAPSLGEQSAIRPDDVRVDRATGAPDPDGCVFADRCRFAFADCATQPSLLEVGERWSAACHIAARWPDEPSENTHIRPGDTGTLTKGDR
ncbi:ABC transporter ATP-binding protein [Nocardia jiangxiensis]|uniref:ABC transporter ATP-binding protein n=1 Tax=Nocardia jiangxiensis TaxID=282685 RepID=A0ABW6RUT9_9NOCA|nr:ABC transporter ATP-binding protein [Nocardia jiangxiensis]